MGVVVAMLVQAGHEDWIRWVIEVRRYDEIIRSGKLIIPEKVLEIALAARTEIVLAVDGANGAIVRGDDGDDEDDGQRTRNFGGPSKDAVLKFTQHGTTSARSSVITC